MNIISYIINRIRLFGNRFAGIFGNRYRMLYTGCIYKMNYGNWKHDPSPLFLCLYSGVRYTHALNLNYLGQSEKQYLGRLIYSLKAGQQVIDPHVLYMLLKRDVYNSIVRKCYRTYFSNLIMQPRLTSSGFSAVPNKMIYQYNDPFIISLNRYLNGTANLQAEVAHYPQELQERVIQAVNGTPVGRGSMISTIPTQNATTGTSINIG